MEFHEKGHRFDKESKEKTTNNKKSRWLEHLQRKVGGKE